MSITLSPDLQTFALVAGNDLLNAGPFTNINSAGNAGYTTFSTTHGSTITYNGTTPVGMAVSPPTLQIAEIYGPGGIYDQIYALSPVTTVGDITVTNVFGPGTYEIVGATGTAAIISATITLSGTSTDQWIFRSPNGLTFTQGFGFEYQGAPNSCNIYWASGTGATGSTGDITFNAVPSNSDLIIPGTFIAVRDFLHTNFTQGLFGPVFAQRNIYITPSPQVPTNQFTSQSNGCRILCVVPDTKVLLITGNYVPISSLKRGDYVASDGNLDKSHRIARVEKTEYSPISIVTLMTFEKDSLGENIPNTTLKVTSGHPIFYNGKRISAYCFHQLPGVKAETKHIRDLIGPSEDGKYYLYDLQFEEDGSYVVEGVKIQSRKPRSFLTPLAKELYFNIDLYQDILENDYLHSSGIEFSPLEMLA